MGMIITLFDWNVQELEYIPVVIEVHLFQYRDDSHLGAHGDSRRMEAITMQVPRRGGLVCLSKGFGVVNRSSESTRRARFSSWKHVCDPVQRQADCPFIN